MKNPKDGNEPFKLIRSENKDKMLEAVHTAIYFDETVKEEYYESLRKEMGITKKDLISFKSVLNSKGNPNYKEMNALFNKFRQIFFEQRNMVTSAVIDILNGE